ncbi:hypothetical protein CBR_g6673 [Chara braunii]|uniref:Uncharacterized protein n=1 Tax=Chara braunii TaxID=69332 RepID=A0A388KKJ0_CHABU|nr:hypothetical protein CBR_g6673 [Chara braunii]|eukprot:GBG70547.1 hypothetical protein CBR_g6673 [Chara braunii]
MAKVLAKQQEEEKKKRALEEEESRSKEKKDREEFQKQLNDAWNAKFEAMCGSLRSGRGAGANEEEINKLKKQVESLQIRNTQGNSLGASTSKAAGGDDAFLARMMQEQEIIKQPMETAMKACQRMESLEEEIRTLKKAEEEAVMEAEIWKKEALKSGNKQQENAKLKEELSKRDAGRKETPRSSFPDRLDDVDKEGKAIHKSSKGKKKVGEIDSNTNVDREVFIREAAKELRGKKKDAITEICLKEGAKYTTLGETIAEIIAKRVERAFGKRPAIQELSDDVAGDPLHEDKEDGRDSATS